MRLYLLALLIWLASPLVQAQTAYVTDHLRLGLHEAADTSDRAFRTLESGQQVEIIERNRNYARVRLPDGTVGHVKAAYLVEEKPAKLIVNEVQAQNEDLQNKLAELNAAFSQPAETIAVLEQQVSESQSALDDALAANDDLTEQNASLLRSQEQYQYALPVPWVGAALAVVLLGGFIGGLWWTDYRSRKRHGGIRLY